MNFFLVTSQHCQSEFSSFVLFSQTLSTKTVLTAVLHVESDTILIVHPAERGMIQIVALLGGLDMTRTIAHQGKLGMTLRTVLLKGESNKVTLITLLLVERDTTLIRVQ